MCPSLHRHTHSKPTSFLRILDDVSAKTISSSVSMPLAVNFMKGHLEGLHCKDDNIIGIMKAKLGALHFDKEGDKTRPSHNDPIAKPRWMRTVMILGSRVCVVDIHNHSYHRIHCDKISRQPRAGDVAEGNFEDHRRQLTRGPCWNSSRLKLSSASRSHMRGATCRQ